ncbi:hypothetical protein PENTCL1PPCAC_908 [Pristionchus entomophagus]|uniref:CARD domain-containing protein n=1 Tax=Pristionchus entomophagus TaxID=358040 RepID=A0AAV5SDI4_9BILA|nr:hypothetical protein PENTCL1PPCAC_908 [Pristionchus entomophagus]
MAAIPCSRSLADMRAFQADNLDRLRDALNATNPKDFVPTLVARNVLRSFEMSAVYSKATREEQIGELIEILKTKNHWVGPMTDALIRNGQALVAKQLIELQR